MLCFIVCSNFSERDNSEPSISSSLDGESDSCGELKSLENKLLLAEITTGLLFNAASCRVRHLFEFANEQMRSCFTREILNLLILCIYSIYIQYIYEIYIYIYI